MKSAPFQPSSNINIYAPLSECSEKTRNYLDINWGSFRKREITLRVLEATGVHALVCQDIWQYLDSVTVRPLPLLPLPGKVRPNPLLPNSSVFWHKGGERKLLLCSLGHFSHVLLALFLRGSDTSASFHINWPFRHVPWLCDSVSDLSTCFFPLRSKCTLCIYIPTDQKGWILLKIPNKEAPTLTATESCLPDS